MTPTPPAADPSPAAPHRLPVVAVVGRPNVGKSTLFNRLLRQRKAVVDDAPGVTRDRNFARAQWDGVPFVLVDTGGIDEPGAQGLGARVQEQTRRAVAEADVVIFLFDGREGLNPADAAAVDLLRRGGKPVFFAVNKVDGEKQELTTGEFFSLGLDALYPISAAHGRGVADLMDAVVAAFPRGPAEELSLAVTPSADEGSGPLRVAIIGRPNVGKSSLLNRLVGFERSLVDAAPGTTRDAVDSLIEWHGRPVVLVDTAGARRRARVHERVEQASVMLALNAVERAEVCLLVIDGVQGMADQDVRLAHYAWDRGRGLILVVNKWDAVPPDRKNQARYTEELHYSFPVTVPLPVIFLSALTGARMAKLLPTVERVARNHAAEFPTAPLNRHFQEWSRRTPPPSYKGKTPRLFYVTQTGTRPPQLAVFTSTPAGFPPTYIRYLENQLRQAFDLTGTPVKLSFRARRKEQD